MLVFKAGAQIAVVSDINIIFEIMDKAGYIRISKKEKNNYATVC